mgnify:FL=1
MSVKNYYQQIITYYPLIVQLKKLSYSLPEILDILNRDHQFKIESATPAQYLSTALSQIKSNKVNKKFEDYMILSGIISSSKAEYEEFCVEIEPDCYLTHISKNVNKAYIVNESNIHKLGSIRACLIAKRILKLHHLSDKQLVHNFIIEKNKWNVTDKKYELSSDDNKTMQTIHDQILNIFETSVRELKLKPTFYEEIFDEKI